MCEHRSVDVELECVACCGWIKDGEVRFRWVWDKVVGVEVVDEVSEL